MAKKQTPKKQPNKVSKAVSGFWQKNWFAVLLVVVLLGVLAFIGVNRLIIYNQKKQFDQAEKSLDTLYADIVKNVGQPTSMKKDKSCSYRSEKYSQGERSCSVDIYMYFNDVNQQQDAMDLALRVEDSLMKNERINLTSTTAQNNNPYVSSHDYNSSDGFKFKDQQLSCYSDYTLDKQALFSDTKSFRVTLSCYGNSRSEFYPVKN